VLGLIEINEFYEVASFATKGTILEVYNAAY